MVEKNLRNRTFGCVIDPTNIQKSLDEIFQESKLENNPSKYLKFLSFISKTIIQMQKRKKDSKFTDDLVHVLSLQRENPDMKR